MMKLMDNQLEITTKRTIMENEQMHSELAYQSRQSEKIAVRNKELADENADLRRQVELAKQTEVTGPAIPYVCASPHHVSPRVICNPQASPSQERP